MGVFNEKRCKGGLNRLLFGSTFSKVDKVELKMIVVWLNLFKG